MSGDEWLRITERDGEILVGIDMDLGFLGWTLEAQNRLLADIEAVDEPEKPSLVDELLDENAELRRDGQMEIDRLANSRAWLAAFSIIEFLVILWLMGASR